MFLLGVLSVGMVKASVVSLILRLWVQRQKRVWVVLVLSLADGSQVELAARYPFCDVKPGAWEWCQSG